MPFLTANIDRAIVVTQFELRGFFHPLGFRVEAEEGCISPKNLDAATGNFIGYALGLGGEKRQPTDTWVPYFQSTYEDYLDMCRRFASSCDLSQKEAVQLIIIEIVRQNGEMRQRVADGRMESDKYLEELDKGNRWGKAVLALIEAFEVSDEQVAA